MAGNYLPYLWVPCYSQILSKPSKIGVRTKRKWREERQASVTCHHWPFMRTVHPSSLFFLQGSSKLLLQSTMTPWLQLLTPHVVRRWRTNMLWRLKWGYMVTKDQERPMGTQGKAKEIEKRDVPVEHQLNGWHARNSRPWVDEIIARNCIS